MLDKLLDRVTAENHIAKAEEQKEEIRDKRSKVSLEMMNYQITSRRSEKRESGDHIRKNVHALHLFISNYNEGKYK